MGEKAFAIVTPPTNTPGPTPTPLPGDLYGLWDIEVGPGVFHCIARTDQDPVSLALSATAQCYSESGTEFTGAEPPCDAAYATGVTPPPTPTPSSCGGQVAPPPYTNRAPVMFAGSYNPLTYTVSYRGCFADVGGTLRPNVIVQFSALGASATANIYGNRTNADCASIPQNLGTPTQSNLNVTMTGVNPQRDFDGDGCKDAVELWAGRPGGSTNCGDDPYNPLDSTPLTSASDVVGDYSMVASLERQDITGCPSACTNVPGAYIACSAYLSPLATPPDNGVKAKALCTFDVNRLVIAGTPQAAQVVNPNAVGGTPTCPTAPKQFCGDGSPGAAPPGCSDNVTLGEPMKNGYVVGLNYAAGNGPFPQTCAKTLPVSGAIAADATHHCPAANVAGTVKIYCQPQRWLFAGIATLAKGQTNLTGTIDPATNTITLEGCFNPNNPNPPFAVPAYAQTVFDFKTGHGYTSVWIHPSSDCKTGGKPAGPPTLANLPTDLVRQACDTDPNAQCDLVNDSAHWDSDGDGCNDAHELTDTAVSPISPPDKANDGGGLRDPSNRWDFFDPAKSTGANAHKHNSSDISAVVDAYAKNEWKDNGAGGVMLDTRYNPAFDRTGITGSNNWDLGPPNGFETSADILAARNSYNQNCPQTVPVNP